MALSKSFASSSAVTSDSTSSMLLESIFSAFLKTLTASSLRLMRTQRSPMRFRVLTSLGLSSRRRSYSLIAGSIFPFATSFSALAMILSRWIAIGSVPHEQQHRLVHPFERSAVNRRGAVEFQRCLMPLSRVPSVVSKIVDRVKVMIRLHQQIAIDLRHDRGRGDGDAAPVASDQRNLRQIHIDGDGVEEQYVRTHFEILDRRDHGPFAGLQDVDGVDGCRLDDTDGAGAGPPQDQPADVDAVVVIDELGVVDADESGLGVEDDAGRDDRTGQASAADFVRAGNGPETRIAEPALDR